jgi:hypothetical protein
MWAQPTRRRRRSTSPVGMGASPQHPHQRRRAGSVEHDGGPSHEPRRTTAQSSAGADSIPRRSRPSQRRLAGSAAVSGSAATARVSPVLPYAATASTPTADPWRRGRTEVEEDHESFSFLFPASTQEHRQEEAEVVRAPGNLFTHAGAASTAGRHGSQGRSRLQKRRPAAGARVHADTPPPCVPAAARHTGATLSRARTVPAVLRDDDDDAHHRRSGGVAYRAVECRTGADGTKAGAGSGAHAAAAAVEGGKKEEEVRPPKESPCEVGGSTPQLSTQAGYKHRHGRCGLSFPATRVGCADAEMRSGRRQEEANPAFQFLDEHEGDYVTSDREWSDVSQHSDASQERTAGEKGWRALDPAARRQDRRRGRQRPVVYDAATMREMNRRKLHADPSSVGAHQVSARHGLGALVCTPQP